MTPTSTHGHLGQLNIDRHTDRPSSEIPTLPSIGWTGRRPTGGLPRLSGTVVHALVTSHTIGWGPVARRGRQAETTFFEDLPQVSIMT